MKFNPIPLITVCLLVSISAISQDDSRYLLRLQSGAFIPEKNISIEKISTINQRAVVSSGKSFIVIQFEQLPTDADQQQLQRAGIELIDYVSGNAYTAIVTGLLRIEVLQQSKVRAVVPMTVSMKMHPALLKSVLPAYAIKVIGTIDVWISFPKLFSFATVSAELTSRNFEINNSLYDRYRIIGLRIPQQRLQELASLSFIDYVQPAPPEEQLLNDKSTSNARANVITSSLGRNLTGEGVVIGIGDNGDPIYHPDFTGHFINRHAAGGGAHGQHVMGTAAGAGIQNEKYTGFAPRATILAQLNSAIIRSLPAYVQDHGMVITNNSYGLIVDDCNNFGAYDLTSRIIDQQAFDLPDLQNVFAAGNSGLFGLMNCNYYANGYGTVLSGYQSAKNTISVGNTTENDSLHYVSSRGPVRDGRIKPDITAMGRNVWSAGFGSYWANTGTSMASPAVAGGLALLYQRYRQLNGNANPKNALMKALLLNGATDLGNVGPDYAYGFGWMNLLRSVIMMENNTYYNATITNGGTNNSVITVPSNTAMLKVMLYWNDPAGSPMATPALVNDLDLEVIDQGNPSNPYLPFILDTLPANIFTPATIGTDHINNVEQVVIQSPPPGNYTIRVKGTSITQNPPQEFFVVYDTIPVSTTLTYPMGGEKFLPGDSVYITWDAWGGPATPFTLEYNNGLGWTTINANIDDTLRQYKFFIPTTDTTTTAQVRLTRNSTSMVSTSSNFTILGPAIINLLPDQCEEYIAINWTKVPKATDYEVMIQRGPEMVQVAITTDTFYTYKGLSKDTLYWVSMRPRMSGVPGRRAVALSRQPNSGLCGGAISDNDIKIDSIVSPAVSGRLLTSTALTASHPITVRIKNLDNVAVSGPIDVNYTINGVLPGITETINPTINAGDTYTHTFATSPDLSAAGNYNIVVTVTKTGDPVISNNTAARLVKQLNNPAIVLSDLPFLDDFESAPVQSVKVRQVGLTGRDRYDFTNSTIWGRVRTFINTGIAYSGTKALTLDTDQLIAGVNIDSLTGTFNLAAFDTASHDIRFEFRYKNHGQLANAANRVWIRGADTSAWVQVYDLYANQPPADGSFQLASVRITDVLKTAKRNFSSSFQVRFGQAGTYVAADNDHRAGYTFDDILFYNVINDIEMIRIDTPSTTGCNLGNAEPVRVTLRNTANTAIATVPVVLKVDGNIIVTENAGPIGPGVTTTYTFTTGFANLAAMGSHNIEVYVNLATDSYHPNDTARIAVTNSPLITTFPYLENFEAGTGSWYTNGKNSSWQYVTPSGIHINRAASGTKAWKTGSGYYNDREESYLYSPCFNISGMTNPTLSLSRAINIEECPGGLCDGAWVEYTLDGKTWIKLGAQGQGTNWYNKTYPGDGSLWSDQDTARWKSATIPLPTTNNSRLRLRFVMSSDLELNKEGIAIDDIHIYDNIYGIYDGATMGAPITQTISGGTGWIDFLSGTNKLVASIQPNNQNMGSTDVQAYINTAPVRYYNGQYYHDRNITIKPSNIALADSVIVRFYFLDSETETLIAASGCPTCYKPKMAYELGVSKYSDPNDAIEDGSVLNDNPGLGWLFINAAKAVKVPFDKGYYAEFRVKNFSEFWLNNGGFDNNHPLPVQLLTFAANKANNQKDVIANWKTGSEISVNRFEVELAKGNEELRRNNFIKIGELPSRGNTGQGAEYNFTDAEMNKSGARYYRLKIIDNDGSFTYSAVRSVVFNSDVKWQVYPNPSNGLFSLLYQLNDGERMKVRVYDAAGKMVYQNNFIASGFVQKTDIDMRGVAFAPGLYLLEAESENGKQSFKLLKQ